MLNGSWYEVFDLARFLGIFCRSILLVIPILECLSIMSHLRYASFCPFIVRPSIRHWPRMLLVIIISHCVWSKAEPIILQVLELTGCLSCTRFQCDLESCHFPFTSQHLLADGFRLWKFWKWELKVHKSPWIVHIGYFCISVLRLLIMLLY